MRRDCTRFAAYRPRLAWSSRRGDLTRQVLIGQWDAIYLGEVSEWLKVHAWKACVRVKPHRGFESPPLRLFVFDRGHSHDADYETWRVTQTVITDAVFREATCIRMASSTDAMSSYSYAISRIRTRRAKRLD